MRRLALLLPLLLVGCGGHGGGSSASAAKGGRAIFVVKWPARPARLIPLASNSLVVTLTKMDGTPVQPPKVISNPGYGGSPNGVTTTFTGLPYGDLAVSIEARPETNGTGATQARGSATLHVEEDVPGRIDVALDSTVATLAIAPTPSVVAVGGYTLLRVSAKDKDGAVVLLQNHTFFGSIEKVTWETGDPGVATVEPGRSNGFDGDPPGILRGVAAGTTTVTASLKVKDDGTMVKSPPVVIQAQETQLGVGIPSEFVFGTTATTGNSQVGIAPATVTMTPARGTATTIASTATGPISLGSVTVGEYATSLNTFLVVGHVDADTPATLTVSFRTATATASTTIKPNPLVSVAGPASVAGGAGATGTVKLGLNALADETVALSCDDPAVNLPTSVTVSPTFRFTGPGRKEYTYYDSADFAFTAPSVTTARDVTITATRAGVAKTYTLTITP